MTVPEPYFMKKKEWFYFDEDEFCYKLTDKAPKKARESYKEFYSEVYGGKNQIGGKNENSTKQQR